MKKKIIIISSIIISVFILSFFIPVKTEVKSIIEYENPFDDGGRTKNIKVYYNIWKNPIFPMGLVE